METGWRLVVARGWREEWLPKWGGFPFGAMKMFWHLVEVSFAQHCECISTLYTLLKLPCKTWLAASPEVMESRKRKLWARGKVELGMKLRDHYRPPTQSHCHGDMQERAPSWRQNWVLDLPLATCPWWAPGSLTQAPWASGFLAAKWGWSFLSSERCGWHDRPEGTLRTHLHSVNSGMKPVTVPCFLSKADWKPLPGSYGATEGFQKPLVRKGHTCINWLDFWLYHCVALGKSLIFLNFFSSRMEVSLSTLENFYIP